MPSKLHRHGIRPVEDHHQVHRGTAQEVSCSTPCGTACTPRAAHVVCCCDARLAPRNTRSAARHAAPGGCGGAPLAPRRGGTRDLVQALRTPLLHAGPVPLTLVKQSTHVLLLVRGAPCEPLLCHRVPHAVWSVGAHSLVVGHGAVASVGRPDATSSTGQARLLRTSGTCGHALPPTPLACIVTPTVGQESAHVVGFPARPRSSAVPGPPASVLLAVAFVKRQADRRLAPHPTISRKHPVTLLSLATLYVFVQCAREVLLLDTWKHCPPKCGVDVAQPHEDLRGEPRERETREVQSAGWGGNATENGRCSLFLWRWGRRTLEADRKGLDTQRGEMPRRLGEGRTIPGSPTCYEKKSPSPCPARSEDSCGLADGLPEGGRDPGRGHGHRGRVVVLEPREVGQQLRCLRRQPATGGQDGPRGVGNEGRAEGEAVRRGFGEEGRPLPQGTGGSEEAVRVRSEGARHVGRPVQDHDDIQGRAVCHPPVGTPPSLPQTPPPALASAGGRLAPRNLALRRVPAALLPALCADPAPGVPRTPRLAPARALVPVPRTPLRRARAPRPRAPRRPPRPRALRPVEPLARHLDARGPRIQPPYGVHPSTPRVPQAPVPPGVPARARVAPPVLPDAPEGVVYAPRLPLMLQARGSDRAPRSRRARQAPHAHAPPIRAPGEVVARRRGAKLRALRRLTPSSLAPPRHCSSASHPAASPYSGHSLAWLSRGIRRPRRPCDTHSPSSRLPISSMP
eukprot:Sspe_Gene.2571::Locus_865_Transcript_1_1_Confidence_1.000_Length_4959::g.2571::m.2571